MRSWGGLPSTPQQEQRLQWRDQLDRGLAGVGLVVGMGRSYGDVGLAANGRVLKLSGLDHVLSFDRKQGVLRCEAGISLGRLLELTMPAGWVLPVVPGTRFVTVGGAIANDVHGKNHHCAGCFGRHVRSLLLRRSDGTELRCSAVENPDWFKATIAGLGLTGCIVEAELQLTPVSSSYLETENIKFAGLDEFMMLSAESDTAYEYAVAWIDCLSKDMRGHFSRGNFSEEAGQAEPGGQLFSVPFAPPLSPVNRYTLSLFNAAYYNRQREQRLTEKVDFYQWMFPLDRVGNWNLLYGRRGFRQYQCVVDAEAVPLLLEKVRLRREGSFLAVLKKFGEVTSPGLLSFPRPGLTLALDFPWRGERTQALFGDLDVIVREAGGAIYPAKDAHMSAEDFQQAYPAWQTLEQCRDAALDSLFWQRVTGRAS